MSDYNFEWETVKKSRRNTADVTIYENGLVYFSAGAIQQYGLMGRRIRWAEDKERQKVAFTIADDGRSFRGKYGNATSCPLEVARRYVGKHNIRLEDGYHILDAVVPTAEGEGGSKV